MSKSVNDFFRDHSDKFLEMALKTDKFERIEHPDGYGKHGRKCGDALEIFLTARNGEIESASFYTEGCIYTSACANALVRMIEGKPTRDAWMVGARDLIDFLETLPERESHCAELAVSALRAALLDLSRTEKQPWIKLYRK